MMQGGACGAVPGIRAQFAVPRNVYILVFNSPLFPAHWCFWIPHADNTDVGKRIHASGDASNGFTIVFERNYDLRNTERRHQVVPLAQVLDHYVVDVKGNGSPSTDNTAYDYLEQVALSVPAPAGSLVSASTPVRSLSCCDKGDTKCRTVGANESSQHPKLPDMAPTGGSCTCTRWGYG
ncbi:hypothetical protein MMC24_002577 [Lignoscripta atroalba]|nr:hypothetical protein [Lignoscripta atroalba]